MVQPEIVMLPHKPEFRLIDAPSWAEDFIFPTAAPLACLPTGTTWLDFADLSAFEQVRNQYSDRGVQFEGAIALQPSNPAFISETSPYVLMPTANQAGITAHLNHVCQRIGGYVRSFGQVVLTALDSSGKILAQASTEVPDASQTALNGEMALPLQKLELTGPMSRLVFHANAPFTLNYFFLCS